MIVWKHRQGKLVEGRDTMQEKNARTEAGKELIGLTNDQLACIVSADQAGGMLDSATEQLQPMVATMLRDVGKAWQVTDAQRDAVQQATEKERNGLGVALLPSAIAQRIKQVITSRRKVHNACSHCQGQGGHAVEGSATIDYEASASIASGLRLPEGVTVLVGVSVSLATLLGDPPKRTRASGGSENHDALVGQVCHSLFAYNGAHHHLAIERREEVIKYVALDTPHRKGQAFTSLSGLASEAIAGGSRMNGPKHWGFRQDNGEPRQPMTECDCEVANTYRAQATQGA